MAALIGVWTAGLVAASAAYSIHRPLVVPLAGDRVSRAVSEVQPLPEDPTATEEEIMMMPADTIVATVPRLVVPAPVRAALRCRDWVDLAQGPVGAQVRYCE